MNNMQAAICINKQTYMCGNTCVRVLGQKKRRKNLSFRKCTIQKHQEQLTETTVDIKGSCF